METWKREEFDGQTEGDIALEVFKLQKEVRDLESKRSEAMGVINRLENELRAAKIIHRDIDSDYRWTQEELRELEEYLRARITADPA